MDCPQSPPVDRSTILPPPHAMTEASPFSARLCTPPAATATTFDRPEGTSNSPNWSSSPQAITVPSAFNARLWLPTGPAAMATTLVSPGGRFVAGCEEYLPHKATVPSAFSAREKTAPLAIATSYSTPAEHLSDQRYWIPRRPPCHPPVMPGYAKSRRQPPPRWSDRLAPWTGLVAAYCCRPDQRPFRLPRQLRCHPI